MAPIVLEYVRNRPPLDLWRYAALRLLEDAAYGSGVVVSVVRERRPRALLPRIRWPALHGK
jgi:mycofactocin glycosyltransferase